MNYVIKSTMKLALVSAFSLLGTLSIAPSQAAAVSDDAVRQQMIQESLDDYPGNCPCPYNTMRNGRSCGGRSAYSRPGGYSPLCYKDDISDEEVSDYRQSHGLAAAAKPHAKGRAASSR
ncbi:hypothetical protein [Zymobacter sp. IVIA_5232.4 C2]|uniref:hypothetical protein n=1 Tax=Zymobacter sp. IVIA_5232.4 C2 TaxID=3394855 RepID=UPI0039C4A622